MHLKFTNLHLQQMSAPKGDREPDLTCLSIRFVPQKKMDNDDEPPTVERMILKDHRKNHSKSVTKEILREFPDIETFMGHGATTMIILISL
jgi:hypothetical protein